MGQSPLINNSTGVPDPSWVASGTSSPFGCIENNWPLCQWDNLANGPHVLEVTSPAKDRLLVRSNQLYSHPQPHCKRDGSSDHNDADIHLDSPWADLGGIANYTSQKGVQMQFSFVGA